MAQTRRLLLPAPTPTKPTGARDFLPTGRSTRGPRRAARALVSELGARVPPLLGIFQADGLPAVGFTDGPAPRWTSPWSTSLCCPN